MQRKIDLLENQVRDWKERAERAELEKEHSETDAKARIEGLEYKLINKLEQDDSQDDHAFGELLSMCSQDMGEILDRIKKGVDSETVEEQLRSDIITGEKQRNEIKY